MAVTVLYFLKNNIFIYMVVIIVAVLFQASEKYVFSVTYNNLFILGATVEDNGLYKCSASNLLGKVTQQCEIKMKESTPEVCIYCILNSLHTKLLFSLL